MAELLVRVKDKINSDFYLNCKCTKRGDVIVIQPDNWPWGKEELANPEWQIIKLPGLKPSDLSGYLAEEVDKDPQHPSKTLQRRAFKFDLANYAQQNVIDGSKLDGNARTDAALVTNLDLNTSLSYQIAKPAIADPQVIGDNSNIL